MKNSLSDFDTHILTINISTAIALGFIVPAICLIYALPFLYSACVLYYNNQEHLDQFGSSLLVLQVQNIDQQPL